MPTCGTYRLYRQDTQYVDGKLVLRDPATGERIHLESFGAGNAAVFAQLHRVGLPPSSSHQGVKP
jgi:hypothetical protein